MDQRIVAKIEDTLAVLESDEGVAILLAVESGSRAWGFPSTDSDYDVRFVYARHPDWYLSIDLEEQRDVIERPLQDMFGGITFMVRGKMCVRVWKNRILCRTDPDVHDAALERKRSWTVVLSPVAIDRPARRGVQGARPVP